MTFEKLGLSAALVEGLLKQNITAPTAIQAAAIPELMSGKDIYLQAETGTGKTLGYLLPLFSKIDVTQATTQAIIVAPTHELAIQIQRQCSDLAQNSAVALRVLLLIGGTSRDRQLEKLKKKPHLVVGSPGRLLELIEAKKLKAHAVKHIVFDEADKLLGPERLSEIKNIIRSAPRDRQLIFASATKDAAISSVLNEISPGLVISHTAPQPVAPNLKHLYCVCEERDKPELVRKLLNALQPDRAMVFVHRNETAQIVTAKLLHHQLAAADLHGAEDKEERKRAMDDFRSGKVTILLASDVGARGLDIKGITHVLNMDVPSQSSGYLHRVGRTARAGNSGVAISLITEKEKRLISRFEKELGIEMIEVTLRAEKLHEARRSV